MNSLRRTIAGTARALRESGFKDLMSWNWTCLAIPGGRPFIVMEVLEGESLRDRIAGSPVPLPELPAVSRTVSARFVTPWPALWRSRLSGASGGAAMHVNACGLKVA